MFYRRNDRNNCERDNIPLIENLNNSFQSLNSIVTLNTIQLFPISKFFRLFNLFSQSWVEF